MTARALVTRAERTPQSVDLLGYSDFVRIFMPIGREWAAKQRDYACLVGEQRRIHDDEQARGWARLHATTALHRPAEAAAVAIAFFARRCAEHGMLEPIYLRKAAE